MVRGILPHTHIQTGWVCGSSICVLFQGWGAFLRLFASAFICFLASLQSHVTGSQLVTLTPIKIPAILRWSIIRAEANRGTWWHTRHSLHLLLSSPSSRGQKGKKKTCCAIFHCFHAYTTAWPVTFCLYSVCNACKTTFSNYNLTFICQKSIFCDSDTFSSRKIQFPFLEPFREAARWR